MLLVSQPLLICKWKTIVLPRQIHNIDEGEVFTSQVSIVCLSLFSICPCTLSASMFVCMCGQEPVAKSCRHRGIDRVVQLVPHITLDKAVSLLLHDGDCSWPMKSAFAVHYTEVSGPLLCTCFPYSAVFCSTPQQSQMDLRNNSLSDWTDVMGMLRICWSTRAVAR